MLVQQAQEMAGGSAGPYSAACGLVRAVGRSGFVHELLEASRAFAPVDFVSIFLFPSKDKPIFVGTEGRPGQRFADSAADHYLTRHYRDDPNIEVLFDGDGRDKTVTTYLRRDDVPTASYRTWCYDRAQIADRLSLLSHTDRGLPFSVSFYGGRAGGNLPEPERASLLTFFPYVRAAALRHLELWRDDAIDLDTARARLTERFPTLSRREADVAAGVVAGLTADEIGDWLGIAATSVITHRKRAYERLGVANQRELLQAFYAS